MTLVKELELLRDGLNSRRERIGWGRGQTDLGNADLTEGLFNLIGTLIKAYSDEDEMHAVQDDTPDVERGNYDDELAIHDNGSFRAGTPSAMRTERITVAALAELARAKTKFPEWPKDPIHAYAVVQEEVGEGIRAALHAMYENDNHSVALAELRGECTQSIAMLYRFVLSLDKYDWTPSDQLED